MIYPRTSRMLCLQLSLALFSMLGGIATSFNSTVFVLENAPVGTVVARHKVSPQSSRTYRILDGNVYERFGIAESQGVVEVAKSLDYQMQSTYQLHILISSGRKFTENTSLWTLTVHVLDVTGYPPHYNKTCETPERFSGLPRLVEFTDYFFNASSSGGFKLSDAGAIVNASKSTVYFGVANDICEVNVTLGFKHVQDVATFHELFNSGYMNLTQYIVGGDNMMSAILIDRTITRDGPEYQQFVPPMVFSELVASKGLDPAWIDDQRYRFFLLISLGVIKTASPVTQRIVLTNVISKRLQENLNITAQITVKLAGCPQGKYGAYCDKNCTCKNEARCHGFNGACLCAPGWKCVVCDIPTPAVAIDVRPKGNLYITGKVSLQCRPVHVNISSMTWWYRSSRNNSSKVFIQTSRNFSISPILPENNGVYTCEATTSDGQTLERNYVLDVMECPPGLHGERCDRPCDCLHHVGCDRSAECVCETGWTGSTCNMSCPSGKFGTNCEQPCGCEDGAECNPFNGTCFCPSDLTGKDCEVKRLSLVHTARKTSMFLAFLVFILPVVILLACIRKRRKSVTVQKTHEELQLVDFSLESNLAEALVPWERDPQHLTLGELVGLGTFGHVVEGTLQLPGVQAVRVDVKTVDIKVNQGHVHEDFDREMNTLVHLFAESLHTQGDEKVMHPNIIQLLGVVTLYDPKRIVLEFAAHGDLQTYLASCRLLDDMDAVDWATLLGIAVDVAKALQELERVRIVHRDVAARNVVITDGMVAKLADFGLARDVYTNTVYERTTHHGRDELLPLKWMALESLRYGVYTYQSDVWSFGVMLWEIASLGEEPRYPGPFRPDCCQMVNMLTRGVRMEKPEECSADLYRLMCQCWRDVRDHRPTAAQLEERLVDQVEKIEDGAVDCMTV
ncbi:uncharacterized protein LOC144868509 [Branchiostoma floridae x Branchiostoma japonicum]